MARTKAVHREVEQWAEANRLATVVFTVAGRSILVARDKPFPEGDPLQQVAAASLDGGVSVGVRTGGGGRYGIGKVLVARTLVTRAARAETSGREPAVTAVWVDADQDELVRHWAAKLGVELAR